MNIYNRVFLGRYNIEINYPTFGIFELAVLTCFAPLLLRVSKVNSDKIGCNNISQNVIEGIIKVEK
jgi:hypothetical protein